ncbi:MAG: hypothetical protein COB90_10675 [Hyphomicrobiales bacterium]|nr:MAG: hypothetical protein COB90_10675 [Hyphomicrobiales bacterium]
MDSDLSRRSRIADPISDRSDFGPIRFRTARSDFGPIGRRIRDITKKRGRLKTLFLRNDLRFGD